MCFLIDGNINKRRGPGDDKLQKEAYDGYRKAHTWKISVLTDIFGRYIKVEISRVGDETVRTMYTTSDVNMNPGMYLSTGQHGMADIRYTGDGRIIFQFKKHSSTDWMYRYQYKQLHIRNNRMVIE